MIFASNVFLFLYLPLFLVIYYLARPQWRSLVILAGSYLFYAWWRPDFLLLFVAVSAWNYQFGRLVFARRDSAPKAAFRLLSVAVIGNLAALGYFKYANFGADVLNQVLQPLGINTFTLEHIILPLGLSFYLFQAISYVVDVYRGTARPARHFVDFAAYIALFPQLIAGPILHYRTIDRQLRQREHNWDLFSLGVCRFMLGFVKKVLIADSLAPLANQFLSNPEPGFADAWLGTAVAFIQLYFDFSGYSDMAIGLGMMMGFRFAENFNQPFLAMSFTEFWRRWHLTLADFLQNYVYRPLVKSCGVSAGRALFVTMLLSGIWHGASFAFFFFGLVTAIVMLLERRFRWVTTPRTPYSGRRHLLNLLLMIMMMGFFTTGDLAHSLKIHQGMLGLAGIGNLEPYLLANSTLTLCFVVVAVAWLAIAGRINLRYYANEGASYVMQNVRGWQAALLWLGFALAVSRLAANSFSPFLYFQF